MPTTVLAEKPSVARDLARVLGATRHAEGYLEGNGYRVTWAIGHLVTLAEPADIHAEWKKSRRDQLPMLPAQWPLTVLEKTKSQYEIVRKLLTAPDVDQVICALRPRSGWTLDAGHEGELIFRSIQEAAKFRKPVKRLWISSLTDDAIREGFRKLRDGREFDGHERARRRPPVRNIAESA